MTSYDYRAEVRDSILDWLESERDAYSDADAAYDDCESSVTGVLDGSATFNSAVAADHVASVMFTADWDDLLDWLTSDMGVSLADALRDAETLDVYIRLRVFPSVWSELAAGVDWASLNAADLRAAA